MGGGPLVAGAGLLLYTRVGADAPYLTEVLPALLVFSFGLAATVAPLTATVLADADERNAGIASAVNNAIARVAGLIGVAALGPIAHEVTVTGFHRAMMVAGLLVAAGGVLGLVGIVNPGRDVHCEDCPGGQLAGAPVEAGRERVPVGSAA
jgi:hypothetical protein